MSGHCGNGAANGDKCQPAATFSGKTRSSGERFLANFGSLAKI